MLGRHSVHFSPQLTLTPFRIRTYKSSHPQPLYHHHLQAPEKSIHSKAPISPAESPLAQSPLPNPFILRTYKERRGWGLKSLISRHHSLLRFTRRSILTADSHQPARSNGSSATSRSQTLYPQRLQNYGEGSPVTSPAGSPFDPYKRRLYTDVLCFGPNCRIPTFLEEESCTSY